MLPGIRHIAITLVARGLAMVGPFVVSIITARVLGPEDRGQYFLVLSYAAIAAQIANLGLHSSNTYLVANNPERLGSLTVNSLYVAVFIAPVVALVLVVLFALPALRGDSVGSVAFAAIPLAPLMVALLYLTNIAIGVGRLTLFNVLTIFAGVAAIGTAAAAALIGGGTLGFLMATALAMAVSCLVCAFFLLAGEDFRLVFDFGLFRQGVAYALRAYLATLLGFLMMRIGIIALQMRSSFDEIGQFSIAMQISDALVLLPATVGLLLFPGLMRTDPADRWRTTWRAFWGLGTTMSVILAFLALVMPFVLPLVFGEDYRRAVSMTQALMPSVLIISLITAASQYLAAEGFPWRQVLAWGIGFVAQAGLSYWLSAFYGGLGVAIALTGSSAVVLSLIGFEALAMRQRKEQPQQ